MNKDIFSKTRIPNIKQAMAENFADKDANAIYQDACTILQYEIAHSNNRGNKAVEKHLCNNILPGFACYKALLNAGILQEQAVDFIKAEMGKAVQRMARLCKKLSNKRYAYRVFKTLFGLGMKFGYPEEGWTVETIEISKQCLRFDIKSCLYCEELDERGALVLCPAFCQTDHTCYDPLAPGVVFKRNNTLANTGKQCDFCFERGQ
ncbi:L-2-amino-thiazoline-4-carboxylic acid hydrolase [Eubacterium limosum]|uniref:L-2-amino-thiazoline-4-carboxylic acid hydrolase n=1 Tax=Eubacterium limosum TaxID=1736 RepID=UPI001D05C2CE|nr:L-2-amino-thiazoline-4-carboxylic acid hydrolase [Eubacterium limosum]MCB6570570.1 L-2-amino-thiazoline-4-carboxylic acid hydrolase [Eubacterium limosum]